MHLGPPINLNCINGHGNGNGNGHKQNSAIDNLRDSTYAHVNQMKANPPKLSVLYGDPQSPYLRLDPYFMDQLEDDTATRALNSLINAIDASLSEVVQ